MRIVPSAVALALVAAACGDQAAPPAPGTLVTSSKARVTEEAPPADVEQAIDDTTRFAFDVYRRLSATDENLAFSPWSVVTALSMTYPGARGATAEAFEQTMHLSLPAGRYHRAMNTIDRALESRGAGASGRTGPFRLRSTNQLFTQLGMNVVPGFLDLLAEEYGAGVRQLDFAADPDGSRRQINDWVSASTEDLIPELLAPGTITPLTRLALVNTLYFNAAWKTPFEPRHTAPADFTLSDGSKTRVAMMAGEGLSISYGSLDGVEVLDLPYQGDEVSLVILLPPLGKLGELEGDLDGAKLRALVAAATPRSAGVKLPRFEVRTQASLGDVLEALGLGIAFDAERADFSGMSTDEQLAITQVVHEAVVKTDEAGTEAAAATAVVVGTTSIPQYIEVDRPFLFAIRDRPTGAVLFVGRVSRPPAP